MGLIDEDIADLLNEHGSLKDQLGKGLKILTSQKTLASLPIFLAQLKAGNNSQKNKNNIN